MAPIILDFETYFDQQITLKKLNYSAYVPVAEPICVCFIYDNRLHFYNDTDITEALKQIPWDTVTLVGHNLLFDALILKHWYGITAHSYCDTLSLARLHHPSLNHDLGSLAEKFCPSIPKLKEHLKLIQGKTWETLDDAHKELLKSYNKNDVLITARLYERFHPLTSTTELSLIDHTIKLWLNPVIELDVQKAQTAIDEEKRNISEQLFAQNLTKEDVRSDRAFFHHLQSIGYTPPQKWSDKQKKLIPAFAKNDSAFQQFYMQNPELQELLDLKRSINSNIKESRTERLIVAANFNQGQIPIAYNYCGAFTGRFSGSNKTNLQNLPRGSILRDSLVAPDGHQFVVADLAQIEARVLAWLAGEDKILDAFRNKRDLYCELASIIFKKPVNKKDHPVERFIGKCLGPDTLVLTQRGWHPIIRILTSDLLWDGVSWVRHNGLKFQGFQSTLTSHGITATSSHLIRSGDNWQKWEDVLTNPSLFQLALNSVNLPSSIGHLAIPTKVDRADGTPLSNVPVVGKEKWIATTLKKVVQHVATLAQKSKQTLKDIGTTNLPWRMMNTENDYLIGYQRALPDAIMKLLNSIHLTENVELAYGLNGESIVQNFLNTSKPWKDGIIPNCKWTESTMIKDTNQGTYDSVHTKRMLLTDDKSTHSPNEYFTWNKNSPTYDLLSAGPRNRFTILSDQGPIIVHNSAVLGLGYGMSANKFETYCALQGQKITSEFATDVVSTYRSMYTKIPELWNIIQSVIHLLAHYDMRLITDKLTIINDRIHMPSGRFLRYEGVHWDNTMWRLINGKRIYGAQIVENIVQALSRDILCENLLAIHPHYPIVMHTHDELITIVPDNQVENAMKFMTTTMTTPPNWAPTLPLNVDVSNGKRYGDCK